MTTKSKNPKRQFPRLLEGSPAAALTHMFWAEPKVPRVRISKDGRAIEFTFDVAIPKEALNEPFRQYWSFFLEPPADDLDKQRRKLFEDTLRKGYERKIMSGERPDHRHIANFLHRTVQDALRVWIEESWTGELHKAEQTDILKPYVENFTKRFDEQVENFEKLAKIKTGPQVDPFVALKVTRSFGNNYKLAETIKAELEQTDRQNWSKVVEKYIPEYPAREVDYITATSTKDFARKITISKMPGVDFTEISFDKYLQFGDQLLKAAAE